MIKVEYPLPQMSWNVQSRHCLLHPLRILEMLHISLSVHCEQPVTVPENDRYIQGSQQSHQRQNNGFGLSERGAVLGHHHEERVAKRIEIERGRGRFEEVRGVWELDERGGVGRR